MASQLLNRHLLVELSEEARGVPRLRKNRNFHTDNQANCHRLLNAIEPGSYVMPHRHLDPEKAETMIVVAGKVGLVLFDDAGAVSETHVLAAGSDQFGVDLAPGTWHSMVALESGSVFFEAKAGPYVPLGEDERAAWAPVEGAPEVADYYQVLRALFAAYD